MHLERSFAHILDCGGLRRTTLRGWENLNKRYKVAAAVYNLSQLMRKLFGFGTPKQRAALGRLLFVQLSCFLALLWFRVRRISDYIELSIRQIGRKDFPMWVSCGEL
jgi:hypothetical protein